MHKTPSSDELNAFLHDLTTRQMHVLWLSNQDMTLEQIASQLGVSAETVKSHRKRLLHKWLTATQPMPGETTEPATDWVSGKMAFQRMLRLVTPLLPPFSP